MNHGEVGDRYISMVDDALGIGALYGSWIGKKFNITRNLIQLNIEKDEFLNKKTFRK